MRVSLQCERPTPILPTTLETVTDGPRTIDTLSLSPSLNHLLVRLLTDSTLVVRQASDAVTLGAEVPELTKALSNPANRECADCSRPNTLFFSRQVRQSALASLSLGGTDREAWPVLCTFSVWCDVVLPLLDDTYVCARRYHFRSHHIGTTSERSLSSTWFSRLLGVAPGAVLTKPRDH